MPELPEVECLTRAVRDLALGAYVEDVTFFRSDLRDPIPTKAFHKHVEKKVIREISRRSKYMLWDMEGDNLGIFHLGMSGAMLSIDSEKPTIKHTHAIFKLKNKKSKGFSFLHFVDPRRFGRIDLCKSIERETHKYFRDLGPEPLEFSTLGEHLFKASRGRSQPVKAFLMDAKNVVGVGNIYACESLFRAKVSPLKHAGRLSKEKYESIAEKIQETLTDAIAAGGTTFSDFKNADGNPGYFSVKLAVYDRKGEACGSCGEKIRVKRLSGRSTFYCPRCQS